MRNAHQIKPISERIAAGQQIRHLCRDGAQALRKHGVIFNVVTNRCMLPGLLCRSAFNLVRGCRCGKLRAVNDNLESLFVICPPFPTMGFNNMDHIIVNRIAYPIKYELRIK
jgi:hypothetical protein